MIADKTKTTGEGFFGKFSHNLTKKGKVKIEPKEKSDEDLDTPRFDMWDDVEYSPKDSFRQASSLFIFIGKWMCFIPLNHNEFKWLSFRVIFSVAAVLCNIAMTVLSVLWVRNSGANILKGGTVLFFGASSIAISLFIRLSMKWPSLIKRWEILERYHGHRKYLSYKYNILTLSIIFITFVEHISSLITGLITVKQDSEEILKHYCESRFPQVFQYVEFRLWIGFPVLLINMVACHTFAFVDQLVIMFSIGLNDFFEDFNERIAQERRQKLHQREWRTFRSDYTRLCTLVSAVDDCICHLLFSSFATHLLTICVELHHSILLSTDRDERIHIIFSFIIAGGQACALCYFTVKVHDKSRAPLNVLYAVPSISYCQEVEVFTIQILKNHVALTGSHIFSMTRRFLLTIIGTVLSFEILLFQLRMITTGKKTISASLNNEIR